ncbi:DEAD/DEAH box helicase [Arcanobacterium haemolyticum]|nr:DEAD/DEAH box helicase [Arcanobacterium haemolyticum]
MTREKEILHDYVDSYAARGIFLDAFQVEACEALGRQHDVLVCAPTGAGKTVVAHYAVTLALATSTRCIYTAPIKALSNQKYAELAAQLGEEYVGLLTGDATIHREAPILVVTTEVLRNMLLQNAPEIADIGFVVLDEVHYLADKDRGPVWEEVILSLPDHVRLVSLSATIANQSEILDWLTSVRGTTTLVSSTVRPVPLDQYVIVGKKLHPLYGQGSEPSASLVAALKARAYEQRTHKRIGNGERRKIIDALRSRDMLPAIEFIFSRKGCDLAVKALIKSDVWLTTPSEQKRIRSRIDDLRAELSESDRRAVGFDSVAAGLVRGYGAHHAGVLPALKTLTENLMDEGLLRIVYATGTLALGIDMPVRSVVVEDLRRFDGEGFVDLTGTEYTQLIGRAGRRGKDKVGHAIVVGHPDLDPWALADLGSGKVEPLISAFQPSYNTVVNLLADRSYDEARVLLGSSLAQFQRNADLGHIEAKAGRIRRRISVEEEKLTCSHGNLVEYLRLRRAAGRAAKSSRKAAKREYQERIAESFGQAGTGRLYAFASEGELAYAIVLSIEETKLRAIDWDGRLRWLRLEKLSSPLREIGAIDLPHGLSLRKEAGRERVAEAILDAVENRTELGLDLDLLDSWSRFAMPRDPAVAEHPCNDCPHLKRHMREGETLISLDKRLAELTELTESFTDSVGRDFDRTADVLVELGILQRSDETTTLGTGAKMLRQLHSESDLLLYSCLSSLREGDLDSADLAGWTSMFLGDDRLGSSFPRTRTLFDAARHARVEADYLQSVEMRHDIRRTGDPTPGCADVFSAWVRGARLEDCLTQSRMAAGDFITAGRRVVDLLGQIAQAGGDTWLGDLARAAQTGMKRGELL